MTTGSSDFAFQGEPGSSDSRDTEIIVIDGPGDTTVRPPRPLLRQMGLAERERLARFQAKMKQAPLPDKSSDGDDAGIDQG
jgi:hypothetical protein